MGRRRPGLLEHPTERSFLRPKSLQSSLGPLRCYWSSMVTSYDDGLRQMKKDLKILTIICIVLFVLPIGISFSIVSVQYKISWIGLVAGLPISLLLSGLFGGLGLYEYHRRKRKDYKVKIYSAWRKVGRERALLSVKQFMQQYGERYMVKERTTAGGRTEGNREVVYQFHNGIEVRAKYQQMGERMPTGWLMIIYAFDQFEDALQLQLSIDDYLDKREILKRRGAF